MKNLQSAYDVSRIVPTNDVDGDVFEATRRYMVSDCGIAMEVATKRADEEVARRIPKLVIQSLSESGIEVAGKDVLDLGAGLGAMSEELALAGARVTAVEPGAAWADLTERRLARHFCAFTLLRALGEEIPVPDHSMDLITSLQVLEHVRSPAKVLAEAWRILRPGGHFYLACENYLAFREGHYQVPWLPRLPKSIGSLYLQVIGRSPRFLNESVTYVTYPGVMRQMRKLGFIRLADERLAEHLRTRRGIKWKGLRVLADVTRGRGPYWLDRARNAFRFGLVEVFRKPR